MERNHLGFLSAIKYEVEKARQELNALAAQQDTLTGLAEQDEEYFALMDKAERTPAEELRLKMYKPILEHNNIISRSDFEYLKSVIADTQKKTAPLKENFERCRQFCDLYSEIAKTYYEISKGDYIARLVEEELKSRAKPRRSLYRLYFRLSLQLCNNFGNHNQSSLAADSNAIFFHSAMQITSAF